LPSEKRGRKDFKDGKTTCWDRAARASAKRGYRQRRGRRPGPVGVVLLWGGWTVRNRSCGGVGAAARNGGGGGRLSGGTGEASSGRRWSYGGPWCGGRHRDGDDPRRRAPALSRREGNHGTEADDGRRTRATAATATANEARGFASRKSRGAAAPGLGGGREWDEGAAGGRQRSGSRNWTIASEGRRAVPPTRRANRGSGGERRAAHGRDGGRSGLGRRFPRGGVATGRRVLPRTRVPL